MAASLTVSDERLADVWVSHWIASEDFEVANGDRIFIKAACSDKLAREESGVTEIYLSGLRKMLAERGVLSNVGRGVYRLSRALIW